MGSISKGIGIGIGVVFGIIIAFLIIGFFTGFIMIGSSKEQTPTGAVVGVPYVEQNKPSPIQEIQKAAEEVQEQVEDLVGKDIEEVNTEDLFKNSKVKNTQKGVTMSLDDLTIEDKGDWGKITNIKITILNEGSDTIFPQVNVMLWDDESSREDKYSVKAKLESDGWIDNGNYKVLDVPVNIAFRNLELEKSMKLTLLESLDWQAKTLVAVEYQFKVEE